MNIKKKTKQETRQVTTWEFKCDACGTLVEKAYKPDETVCDRCARKANREKWLSQYDWIIGARIENIELEGYWQDELTRIYLRAEDGRPFSIEPCCGYGSDRNELDIVIDRRPERRVDND